MTVDADLLATYDETRRYLAHPITVTLTRPESYQGPEESVTVPYVQEQAGTQESVDSPLGGGLDGDRRTFHLWAIECEGLLPAIGYEITHPDGSVWVIKSAGTLAHGRRYRCRCLARVGTVGGEEA